MRTRALSLPLLGGLAVMLLPGHVGEGAAKKRKAKFTVGKQTTYVIGPLDKEGYIDYVAALNKRLSAGIKPADNANVLLWKALGPFPSKTKLPADYFKWLGIPEPPKRGNYFITLDRYAREHLKLASKERRDKLWDCSIRASQWPWTAKDFPEIAAWLEANEKPLRVVIEASKRPHYFGPVVPKKMKEGWDLLFNALLPTLQGCREFCYALTARAMLRVAQGRPDDAWSDLLACHRLARLVARGGSYMEGLVGIAGDAVASRADLAFLNGSRLTAKQIRVCLRNLEKLPPLPSMAEKMDLGERFLILDYIQQVARHGNESLQRLRGNPPWTRNPRIKALVSGVHWDPALRAANRWFDRSTRAMRLTNRTEREKKMKRMVEEVEEQHKLLKDETALMNCLTAKNFAEGRGKLVGNILTCLLLPTFHDVRQAEDRAEQIQANLHLAFALACYRREQGRYPKTLDALAPKYLSAVPRDLFSGKALVYRPRKDGYLLYSVGVNGKDEGGRGYGDDPAGDDLSVRMPPPKP